MRGGPFICRSLPVRGHFCFRAQHRSRLLVGVCGASGSVISSAVVRAAGENEIAFRVVPTQSAKRLAGSSSCETGSESHLSTRSAVHSASRARQMLVLLSVQFPKQGV